MKPAGKQGYLLSGDVPLVATQLREQPVGDAVDCVHVRGAGQVRGQLEHHLLLQVQRRALRHLARQRIHGLRGTQTKQAINFLRYRFLFAAAAAAAEAPAPMMCASGRYCNAKLQQTPFRRTYIVGARVFVFDVLCETLKEVSHAIGGESPHIFVDHHIII